MCVCVRRERERERASESGSGGVLCSAFLSFCPSSIMLVPDGLQHLCVFGLTLNAVLSWPEAHGERTVDVVELWCGVGSITAAAAAAGYVVHKFDKFRVPGVSDVAGPLSEDLLSSLGLQSAVRCVLSMREGALLWMGPVCSSFVFMNSSKCKRTLENPMGDVDYKPVAEGNLHASVAAFLYALACLRGILPIVENPVGSSIFRFPALQSVVAFFSAGSAVCCRCVFANERMGRRFKKAYKLVGHAWVKHLCAPCKCKGGLHCPLVHRVVRNGKTHTSGRTELLRKSAAYPPKMGRFVLRMWQEHGSSSSTSSSTAEDMRWKHDQTSKKRSEGPSASSPAWKTPVYEEDAAPAPSQAWKLLPLREIGCSLSTVHTLRADASSAWKSLPLGDETVGTLPTEHRLPETMSMATSGWKRPHIKTSTRESRPSQGDSALSTGQSSTAWKTLDI